ncbi:MAG: sensor histidine kinase [Aggregatilineales bacterium]
MSEQPTTDSPLSSARALLEKLEAQADSLDAAALKSELAELKNLIEEASQRGEGADAEQLRTTLDKTIQDSASFNSVMVHEVRKPMTSIRGYADMLAKPDLIGPLNDMQKQFLETIRTNVLSMEALVTDISDLNKLNSGRLRPEAKMTTFGQVIMDAQKQVEPLVAKYGHPVTWDVPQGLPILTIDARQLAKVITKLVQNALHYTPRNDGQTPIAPGQIIVKAERLDGNVLHVTITDNGIGMKAEDVARLGEPFFRADHELVTSQKGYGLGIPVALGLLRLMGSTLEITSAPDTGSTFGFRLIGMG